MFKKWLLMAVLFLLPINTFAQEDLTETYTTPDGTFSFRYPAGWVVDQDTSDVVFIFNDSAALEADEFTSGQVGIVIFNPYISSLMTTQTTANLRDDLLAAIASFGVDDAILGELVLTEVGENQAAAVGFVNEQPLSFWRLMLIDSPTGRLLAIFVTYPGEESLYLDTFEAIIASVVYNPDAAPLPTEEPIATQPGGKVIWQILGRIDESTDTGTELERIFKLDAAPDGSVFAANGFGGIISLSENSEIYQVIPVIVDGTNASVNSVEIAPDGSLWVADPSHKQVLQINTEGEILQAFGEQGSGEGQFSAIAPSDVQIGIDGNVYAFDPGIIDPAKIIVFAPDGSFVREIKLPDEDFYSYQDFAIAPDGRLYIAVQRITDTERIEVYEPDGTKIADIPLQVEGMGPVGALLVLEDGTFYATDSFNATIYHFDREGAVLWQFGVKQSSREEAPLPGEFSFATGTGLNGLALLPNGDLIAGDMNDAYAQIVRIVPEEGE